MLRDGVMRCPRRSGRGCVAITSLLAAVGLIVAGIATYAALRSFLVDRVDRTLAGVAPSVARSLTARRPGDRGPGRGTARSARPAS